MFTAETEAVVRYPLALLPANQGREFAGRLVCWQTRVCLVVAYRTQPRNAPYLLRDKSKVYPLSVFYSSSLVAGNRRGANGLPRDDCTAEGRYAGRLSSAIHQGSGYSCHSTCKKRNRSQVGTAVQER